MNIRRILDYVCQKKSANFSIYVKVLLAFILVILPVYLISLFTNLSSAEYARNDIQLYMTSQLSQIVQSLDREITVINGMQREFSSNIDLLRLSESKEGYEEYENQMRMDKIHTQLLMIRNISPELDGERMVVDAKIYIPGRKKVISAANSFDELNMEDYNQQKGLFAKGYSTPYYSNGRLYMNIYFPMFLENEEPMYIFSIEFSKNYLQKMLAAISVNSKAHALIMSSTMSWTVSDDATNFTEANEVGRYIMVHVPSDNQPVQQNININGEEVLLITQKSKAFDMVYALYIPRVNMFTYLSRYNLWVWLISLLSLLVVVVFAFWVYLLIERPLNKFMFAFKELGRGNLDIAITRKPNDEFSYLYNQFNITVSRLKLLISEVYEQKIHVKHAELKQLQYQINPHFLYNTIYIIYRLAKKQDFESILRLSSHLGNFYKTITKTQGDDITLEKEMMHIIDYTSIQDIRFQGRIRSSIAEVPEKLKDLSLPKLSVQPLVENVYEHGLKNKLEGGLIKISFEQMDTYESIIVEDNGDDVRDEDIEKLLALLKDPENKEYSGITNIHRRLQIKYGNHSGLYVSRSTLGGLKLEIRITRGGYDTDV